MELTFIADWLNKTFASFDYTILEKMHKLAESTAGALTPVFEFISLLAEKGIILFIIAVVLMCLKNTRKIGICMFIAIVCGALITNIVLKNLIARPRPFIDSNGIYNNWWAFVGMEEESGFSFPSGHTTATMAAMTAIFLCCNKKYSWTSFIFVILMGMSRNYLMVHYPSDIIGGIVAGGIGALISYCITKIIYYYLDKHPNKKLSKFILEFDVKELIKSKIATLC